MDLELTDEQQLLREAVRELAGRHATPEIVRELEDDPTGYRPELWHELARMDLLGLAIPTDHGGSGMGALETVIVCEELGRAIVPSPYLVTAVAAVHLLRVAGTEAQRAEWLPRIARGEAIVTVAWHEVDRGDGPEGVTLSAEADGDQVVLDGTKIMVPFASAADAIIALVREGDQVELVLVAAGTRGLDLTRTDTLAADAMYEVGFTDVRVPATARLVGGWEAFLEAMDEMLVAVAAYAVGGAEHTLAMTVEYAKERVQFGVPIGNFQGVAHPIADIATEIEGARILVHRAAWARMTGRRPGPTAAMAKWFAVESWRRATRVGHQTFGGVGFTREIDVQLYFRRAKQLELTWFGPQVLGEWIAAAELDAEVPFVGIDAGV